MSRNIHIDLFLTFFFIPSVLRLIGHFNSNATISELIGTQYIRLYSVLIGYIFANYGLFEKISFHHKRWIKSQKLNILLMLMIAICVLLGRYAVSELTLDFGCIDFYINMEAIYAPIFIYAIVTISKAVHLKIIKKALIVIGKYSLLMWFVSCIFFNNCKKIFQPILYLPRNPVLVTIWGLLFCLAVSFVLDKGIQKMNKQKNKLLKL